MSHFVDQSDQIAADLVQKCYGVDGVLACVIRLVGEELRVIGPANCYEELALMLYRAADECANYAPKVRH